jgi:1,4-dihydroxy-2-naphthoate octaprenyltransferase
VLVGSALAFQEGQARLHLFALVLAASLLVQITANLVDEYSDHGRPEGSHKVPAPYKVIARGLLSSTAVRRGALACFSGAAAIGLYLVVVAGWPVLVLSLAGGAVTYLYSAGPRPLGTLGLGQPLVFIFMGPVMVLGTYYVHARDFTLDALWLSLPLACTVTAILAANDLRDLEEDRAAGKVTPVTLFGRRFGRWELTALVAVAFAVIALLVAAGRLGLPSLVAFLALPQAIATLRTSWQGRERPELAAALKAAGKLHGWLGLLLAAGVALGRFP